MRRRRVIVGLVVLAVLAVVAVLLWPRGPQPCRATFLQICEGMTFEEVCATVGGPPGDYTGGRSLRYFVSTLGRPRDELEVWAAEDAFLSITFDNGRVKVIDIDDPLVDPELPPFDRLRARLGF